MSSFPQDSWTEIPAVDREHSAPIRVLVAEPDTMNLKAGGLGTLGNVTGCYAFKA